MHDAGRVQGWLICALAAGLGLLFLGGMLAGAYWAVAIPVALLLAVVLGLTFWVGFTIATIRIEPEPPPDAAQPSGQKQS
jgi:predicted lipid-binding transport protein (Tim44 family)